MFRLSLLAIFVLILSCNNGKNKPDVSAIKVDITINRFEKPFFSIDTNHITEGLVQLHQQYPAFYPTFMQNILQVSGQPSDTETKSVIKNILTNYAGVYDSLQKKYSNIDW